jgi:hypothetical protein
MERYYRILLMEMPDYDHRDILCCLIWDGQVRTVLELRVLLRPAAAMPRGPQASRLADSATPC